MTNKLIELAIAVVVIVVLLYVLGMLLPLLNIPAPFGTLILVVIGAGCLIWALRWLQRQ